MPTKGGQLCGLFLTTFALQYSMITVAVPVAIIATAPRKIIGLLVNALMVIHWWMPTQLWSRCLSTARRTI